MTALNFGSVLVANRGEIAVRILRSAAAAGYRTIAVYSDADADAPHVALADEAVRIGPAAVQDSYLDPERILAAARQTGAEAVHPGYGFLSENHAFAAACAAAGIVFIGPSPEAIELMGNKAAAKRRMQEAGVPCIPGYQSPDQSDEALLQAGADLGAPLMVKAAAGGGGRGMRLVEDLEELPSAIAAARSEARNAFGSDELILERAVREPRHVEIQVFGDSFGSVIHLGERDCSVQRRHQKVIEEAPCPVVDADLRAAMGEAAVAAAQSIAYTGAGTVEFLLDRSGAFYFLEMNTRLQVEHPVTELVTGLDLVDLQLRIARGEALPLTQEAVRISGHAIEVRLYAEDVHNDFLPATGPVLAWDPPTGPGLRVDHGVRVGQEITPYYDPMLAKIVAYGPDRETARRRLVRALHETVLFGVVTNRAFLAAMLARDRFASGEATTAFLTEEFASRENGAEAAADDCVLAAVLQLREAARQAAHRRLSPVGRLPVAVPAHARASRFRYEGAQESREIDVMALGQDAYRVVTGDTQYNVRVLAEPAPGRVRMALDDRQHTVAYTFPARGEVCLQWRGADYRLRNVLAFSAAEREQAGSGAVLAPMHGHLLSVCVAIGDAVGVGDDLAVMEAMKMEHRLTAAVSGTVRALHGQPGDQLAAGAVVLEIEAAD